MAPVIQLPSLGSVETFLALVNEAHARVKAATDRGDDGAREIAMADMRAMDEQLGDARRRRDRLHAQAIERRRLARKRRETVALLVAVTDIPDAG